MMSHVEGEGGNSCSKGASPVQSDDSVPLWIRLTENASTTYFLIKSFSAASTDIALQNSVWATGPSNEVHFHDLFVSRNEVGQPTNLVVLIFSINNSGSFLGYALMTSRPSYSRVRHPLFLTPRGKPFPGRQFDIFWLRRSGLPFHKAEHINNALNDMRSVKVGRDGQEIGWEAGRSLLHLWESFAASTSDHPPKVFSELAESASQEASDLIRYLSECKKELPRRVSFRANPPSPSEPNRAAGPGSFEGASQGVDALKASNQTQDTGPSHENVPAPKYSAGTIELPAVTEGPDFPALSYCYILQLNPLLAIYPIDLTKMDYSTYFRLYQESAQVAPTISPELRPTESQFWEETDWSDNLQKALGLSDISAVTAYLNRKAHEI